jgi:uncharacterized NAD(P)/FAD-binding protein YdhS
MHVLRMMNGLCLHTTSLGAFEVNHVVLCMGNLPSTLFSHLQGIDGYHHSPYPSKSMIGNIPKDESVCVIGTSLSGIDTIVSLAELGHKGKIVCTSRSGRFPSVRGELSHRTPPKPITREQIDLMSELRGGKLRLSDMDSCSLRKSKGLRVPNSIWKKFLTLAQARMTTCLTKLNYPRPKNVRGNQ